MFQFCSLDLLFGRNAIFRNIYPYCLQIYIFNSLVCVVRASRFDKGSPYFCLKLNMHFSKCVLYFLEAVFWLPWGNRIFLIKGGWAKNDLLYVIIGVMSCETFYSQLQFGFSRIAVTEFHKHPLCSEYGSTYSQGIVNTLNKNTLAFYRLWFCFQISVIKTFTFQALGIIEFKETKMYFIFFFFFSYRWFINSTPPAYGCLNFSFLRSYKAWSGNSTLSQRTLSVKL